MPILDGVDNLCDAWLGVNDNWVGEGLPRYQTTTTIRRLCNEGWKNLNGGVLVQNIYEQIERTWTRNPCTGQENWRFVKQLNLGTKNQRLEVPLERTISAVTDCNWANQVPTVGGVDGSGPHHLDLVHRCGSQYSFIELKVDANNPVYAGFQILQYGLLFCFSQKHSQALGYRADELEILRAKHIHLRVLAPAVFYQTEYREWLRLFEQSIDSGLQRYAKDMFGIPMDFGFEAFPDWFNWEENVGNRDNDEVRRNVLWAVHHRMAVFGNN